MVIPRKIWNFNFCFMLDIWMRLFMCICFLSGESGSGDRKALNTQLFAYPPAPAAIGVNKDNEKMSWDPNIQNQVSLELTWKMETGRQRLVSSRRWGKRLLRHQYHCMYFLLLETMLRKRLMKMSEYTAIFEPFGNFL